MEALLPVLKGEVPAVFRAQRMDDILTAVRLAGEFHLRLILSHAAEAYKAADLLDSKKIPVIFCNAPGFVVDVNSRIATLLPGTGYVDTAALGLGTWYYVVRAHEMQTGEEDANQIYDAVTVTACAPSAPEPARKATTSQR